MAKSSQVTLNTNVAIGGKVLNSFNQMAGKLVSLGSTIEQLGSHAREFEIDSLNVYRGYEDNMLAAEYALSSQYRSATELTKVMEGLDDAASQWAATSIFHTSDVSQAINEAAHAGWDYEEILEGIPNAMLIAQAGGLDLSEGLDYLVKMMGSTGTEFEDMTTLIDQWSMAANMSATNIGEMGEAFMSLGASADFADSTQEIFTLLAALANVGTTGSQAGTALRGAMMRIIAPTMKAEDAMELLGADADELEGVLADETVTKAVKTLQGMGFSAYDAQGRLKPMIQIFTELDECLQGLNEQSQNEIIAAIFPTRNVSTAKAFLAAIENGQIGELFQSIGDSAGYASEGAETMMSGLTGSIETLKSKWEEFQRSVGDKLAPGVEKVAGALGWIMDAINGMDDTALQALVDAMTALSVAGPGMLILGGAVKWLIHLGAVGGTITGLGLGAVALVSSLNSLAQISFRENFGEMELDLDALGEHVDSLKTSFDGQLETISEWETNLGEALTSYESLTGKMSETMLTDVLTEKELTPDEKDDLKEFGESISAVVMEGIANAEARDMTFLDAIFGDKETPEEAEVGNMMAQVVSGRYEDLYAEAYDIGAELRRQLTAALADSELDENERQAIKATNDRNNQILAEIQTQKEQEDFYAQLYKAQGVSWDTAEAYIEENSAKMEEDLENLEDTYAGLYGQYRADLEDAIANGDTWTDLNGVTRKATDALVPMLDEQFEREKEKARQEVQDKYGELNLAMFDALMNDSEYSDVWNFMKNAPIGGSKEDYQKIFQGFTDEELRAVYEETEKLADEKYNLFGIKSRLPKSFWETSQGASVSNILDEANKVRQYAWQEGKARGITGGLFQNDFTVPAGQIPVMQAATAAAAATATTTTGKTATTDVPMGVNLDKANQDLNKFKTDAVKNTIGLKASITSFDDTILRNYNAPTINVGAKVGSGGGGFKSFVNSLFAEGGRADTASIFGEAGPEWAIPEEHTERTAELLNAAREASGFTWGDIAEHSGELNTNFENVTVHYSPTITAGDARGVADVLAADKERLLKLVKDLMREQKFRDSVEVYA